MDAQPVPLWESLGLWPSTRVRLGASDGAGRDHGPGAEPGLRACPGKREREGTEVHCQIPRALPHPSTPEMCVFSHFKTELTFTPLSVYF